MIGFQVFQGTSAAAERSELVVLNACYSKVQAKAIKQSVKAVIGTTAGVEDEASRRFTVAFYRALGNGFTICEAFHDGGDVVALHGLTGTH